MKEISKITLPGGGTYEGELEGGKPDGKGVMVSSRGVIYDGYFVNGKKHGEFTVKTTINSIVKELNYIPILKLCKVKYIRHDFISEFIIVICIFFQTINGQMFLNRNSIILKYFYKTINIF